MLLLYDELCKLFAQEHVNVSRTSYHLWCVWMNATLATHSLLASRSITGFVSLQWRRHTRREEWRPRQYPNHRG
jgi:hypothetical protein